MCGWSVYLTQAEVPAPHALVACTYAGAAVCELDTSPSAAAVEVASCARELAQVVLPLRVSVQEGVFVTRVGEMFTSTAASAMFVVSIPSAVATAAVFRLARAVRGDDGRVVVPTILHNVLFGEIKHEAVLAHLKAASFDANESNISPAFALAPVLLAATTASFGPARPPFERVSMKGVAPEEIVVVVVTSPSFSHLCFLSLLPPLMPISRRPASGGHV